MQSIKLVQACTDSVYIIWLKWNTCIYDCSWHWHWLSGFLIRANRVRRKREWGKGCSTQEVPRLVGSGNASSCKRCRVHITVNSFDDTMFFTMCSNRCIYEDRYNPEFKSKSMSFESTEECIQHCAHHGYRYASVATIGNRMGWGQQFITMNW